MRNLPPPLEYDPHESNAVARLRQRKYEVATQTSLTRLSRQQSTHHVYRKSTPGVYSSCIFLDEQELIAAVDTFGCLDLIRWRESSESPSSGAGMKMDRLAGTRLSPDLPSFAKPGCHHHLYGYNRGTSLAVGMPSGDVHIYDSETLIAKRITPPIRTTPWFDVDRPPTVMETLASWNHWHGYRARRPLQRYPWCLSHESENRIELYGWNDLTRYWGTHCHSWDFDWDGNNTLSSLHIGNDGNYIAVTLIDTRQKLSQNAICYQLQGEFQRFQEACWISATSIISLNRSTGYESKCFLTQWDLRHTKSPITLPCFPLDVGWELSATEPSDQDLTFPDDSSFYQIGRFQNNVILSYESHNSIQHFILDPVCLQVRRGLPGKCHRYKDGGVAPFVICETTGHLAFYEPSSSSFDAAIIFDRCTACGPKTPPSNRRHDERKSRPTPRFIMEVNLRDRWGTTTDLNSLSFNHDGTRLAGTSRDGDLFAWCV